MNLLRDEAGSGAVAESRLPDSGHLLGHLPVVICLVSWCAVLVVLRFGRYVALFIAA